MLAEQQQTSNHASTWYTQTQQQNHAGRTTIGDSTTPRKVPCCVASKKMERNLAPTVRHNKQCMPCWHMVFLAAFVQQHSTINCNTTTLGAWLARFQNLHTCNAITQLLNCQTTIVKNTPRCLHCASWCATSAPVCANLGKCLMDANMGTTTMGVENKTCRTPSCTHGWHETIFLE